MIIKPMPMAVILVILALLNSEDLKDGDGDDGDVDKRDSDDGDGDHGDVGKRDSDDGDDDPNGSAGNHRHHDIFLSHISLL